MYFKSAYIEALDSGKFKAALGWEKILALAVVSKLAVTAGVVFMNPLHLAAVPS